MKTIRLTAILFILFLLPGTGSSQCKTISNWAEQRDGLRKLCFYPTTLRMINISKDESFNQMIKNIEKLKIVITDKKQVVSKEDVSRLKKGIQAENYKDMVQVRRGMDSYYVFIKEKDEKPVGFTGIVASDSSLVLLDLEGYISPSVIQQLIEGKINFGAVTKLYDLSNMGDNNPKKQQKKK